MSFFVPDCENLYDYPQPHQRNMPVYTPTQQNYGYHPEQHMREDFQQPSAYYQLTDPSQTREDFSYSRNRIDSLIIIILLCVIIVLLFANLLVKVHRV